MASLQPSVLSLSPASVLSRCHRPAVRGLRAAHAAPSLGCEGPPCCLGAIYRLRGASVPALFVTPQPSSHIFLLSLTWYLKISQLKGASCRLPLGCPQPFLPSPRLRAAPLPCLCWLLPPGCLRKMSSLQAASELLLFLFCPLP